MHFNTPSPVPIAENAQFPIPYFVSDIPAGFPSPAEDYESSPLDLHKYLVKHPSSTFFIKVRGDSMQGAGIFSGDLLIVDKALNPQDGKIIVAILQGEFTVKRIRFRGDKIFLIAENPLYAPIEIQEDSEFQVWGIVTYVIHPCTH